MLFAISEVVLVYFLTAAVQCFLIFTLVFFDCFVEGSFRCAGGDETGVFSVLLL